MYTTVIYSLKVRLTVNGSKTEYDGFMHTLYSEHFNRNFCCWQTCTSI